MLTRHHQITYISSFRANDIRIQYKTQHTTTKMSILINFICRILFNNWMIISLNVHLIIWMRAFFCPLSRIWIFNCSRGGEWAGWLCSRGVVLHNENISARVNNKKRGMYISTAAIRQLLRSSRLNTFLIVCCCCSFYCKHQLRLHTQGDSHKNTTHLVQSSAAQWTR